jgi:hypothetical protein
MYLPLTTADRRIGSPDPLPPEERRVLRRGAPERLAFDPPPPGLPLVAPHRPPLPLAGPGTERGWLRRLAGLILLRAPAA